MKWENKDWVWLCGVLIIIIICILTFRLSDNQNVNDMFSFVASAVSIALAFVAIGMAVKQEVENRRVQDDVNKILTTIETKVNSMNDAVQKITPDYMIQLAEEQSSIVMEENSEKSSYSKDEVNELINQSLVDYGELIMNDLNASDFKISYHRSMDSTEHLIRSFLQRNPEASAGEIAEEFGVSKVSAKRILNKFKL